MNFILTQAFKLQVYAVKTIGREKSYFRGAGAAAAIPTAIIPATMGSIRSRLRSFDGFWFPAASVSSATLDNPQVNTGFFEWINRPFNTRSSKALVAGAMLLKPCPHDCKANWIPSSLRTRSSSVMPHISKAILSGLNLAHNVPKRSPTNRLFVA